MNKKRKKEGSKRDRRKKPKEVVEMPENCQCGGDCGKDEYKECGCIGTRKKPKFALGGNNHLEIFFLNEIGERFDIIIPPEKQGFPINVIFRIPLNECLIVHQKDSAVLGLEIGPESKELACSACGERFKVSAAAIVNNTLGDFLYWLSHFLNS